MTYQRQWAADESEDRMANEGEDRMTDEGRDQMVDSNKILKSLKQLTPKAK